MRRIVRVIAWCSAAVLLSSFAACSSGSDEEASTTQQRAQRRASNALVRVKGIDARHPQRPALLTPTVVAVDVPERTTPGERVTIRFETTPDSSCALRVIDEDGEEVVRMPPVVSDATGHVSWSWTPKAGDGQVAVAHVVCSGGERGSAEIVLG